MIIDILFLVWFILILPVALAAGAFLVYMKEKSFVFIIVASPIMGVAWPMVCVLIGAMYLMDVNNPINVWWRKRL